MIELEEEQEGIFGDEDKKHYYHSFNSLMDWEKNLLILYSIHRNYSKVAQRLNGFEMNILAYDPFAKNVPDYVTLVDLPELMSKSDFVLVHARAMKETEHMINRELIAMMKPTAYLINTARSSLVDEQALYEALRDKKIIGAALDVFDVEPPTADYPIVALPNVTVTPHLAGGSVDAFTNSPILLSKEMIHITEKKSSPFVVNKEIFDQVVAGLE